MQFATPALLFILLLFDLFTYCSSLFFSSSARQYLENTHNFLYYITLENPKPPSAGSINTLCICIPSLQPAEQENKLIFDY